MMASIQDQIDAIDQQLENLSSDRADAWSEARRLKKKRNDLITRKVEADRAAAMKRAEDDVATAVELNSAACLTVKNLRELLVDVPDDALILGNYKFYVLKGQSGQLYIEPRKDVVAEHTD